MEQRSYICLNCQVPLKLEYAQRRPESADSEKKNERPLVEILTGHSKNLLKLIMDSKFPSEAPVCVGCSDALSSEMDTVLASKEEEISTYKTYMDTMAQNHPSSEIPELKARLQNLVDEEKQLEMQLKKLLAEEALLDQELQTKRRAAEQSAELTGQLWGQYRDNLRIVYNDQNILRALEAERSYADVQLRKLIETSVLDLCFHIWVESNVGEINGFRLGYLKESPVEFSEINSAFGQVVLLIEVLFELIGVQHHELVTAPLGSHSYIKLRHKDDVFPMFGQGTPLSGSATLLDSGIRKFLQMLDFLQKEVKDRNKSFKPPFQIVAESLVDNGVKYSAVMTLNTEVRWTRAMAMMLTNLKAVCGQINALRNPA